MPTFLARIDHQHDGLSSFLLFKNEMQVSDISGRLDNLAKRCLIITTEPYLFAIIYPIFHV